MNAEPVAVPVDDLRDYIQKLECHRDRPLTV
jgi:hypothetical protein